MTKVSKIKRFTRAYSIFSCTISHRCPPIVSATNYTYSAGYSTQSSIKKWKSTIQNKNYYPLPETPLSHSSFLKILRKYTPQLVVRSPPRNSVFLPIPAFPLYGTANLWDNLVFCGVNVNITVTCFNVNVWSLCKLLYMLATSFCVQRSLSAPNVLQAEIRTLHNGDAQDTMHSAKICLTIVQNEVFCSWWILNGP